MNTPVKTCIASALIVVLAAPVHAEMLEPQPVSGRQRIEAALKREDVRAELQARGVSAEQAKARVAALTDEEAQRLVAEIDSAPAGGFIQVLGPVLAAAAYAVVGLVYVAAVAVALVVKGISTAASSSKSGGQS